MSSLVQDVRRKTRLQMIDPSLGHAALRFARAVLGWPLRVHANRKLVQQMAGMSAYELADIGLTSGDVRDTAALPLDAEAGQFLAGRVAEQRAARHRRRR